MNLPILSAKMKVKWAVEASVGAGRPTSGYAVLDGVKSISSDNEAPNTVQVTELKDFPAHVYIPGLMGGNGVQNLTVNDYSVFRTSYSALYSAWETAYAAGKNLWIEYAYPPDSSMESYFYPAIPSKLGFGGAEVDAPLENVAYFTRCGQPVFAAASTNSTT